MRPALVEVRPSSFGCQEEAVLLGGGWTPNQSLPLGIWRVQPVGTPVFVSDAQVKPDADGEINTSMWTMFRRFQQPASTASKLAKRGGWSCRRERDLRVQRDRGVQGANRHAHADGQPHPNAHPDADFAAQVCTDLPAFRVD